MNKTNLKELIARNYWETLIGILKYYISEKDENFSLMLVQLEGRFRELKIKQIEGVLSQADEIVQTNLLRRDFTAFIELLPENVFSQEDALNNIALNSFIDKLQSKEALHTVAKALAHEDLIEISPHLGTADVKKELKENFQLENSKHRAITEAVLQSHLTNAVKNSSSELKVIYNNRNHRSIRTFYLKWGLFGLTAFLMVIACIIIFSFESLKKLGFAGAIGALISAFYGNTISKMHKEEDDNLKTIEKDMQRLAKLEKFFSMIDTIGNEEQKKDAYMMLIQQMKV